MPKRTFICLLAVLTLLLFYGQPLAARLLYSTIERVSVAGDGSQANGTIAYPVPVISGDGRITAFSSHASNLVEADTNFSEDLFLHNRLTGETQMVNLNAEGNQTDDFYKAVEGLSDDGRFAVFAYHGLVEDATGSAGIYVRDVQRHTVELITRDATGRPLRWEAARPDISGDGNVVAFIMNGPVVPADTTFDYDAYVYYRDTDTLLLASVNGAGQVGNDDTTAVTLSGDGAWLAFSTQASNFHPQDIAATPDIVLRHLPTGALFFISQAANGEPANAPATAPALSDNGRYVAFASAASNLVPDDTNDATDIFVRDVVAGSIERVSLSGAGVQLAEGTEDVTAISADGRYVAFISSSPDVVPNDGNGHDDVFVVDRDTGQTERISLTDTGAESETGGFYGLDMSNDGRYVMFFASAGDLVPNDTNAVDDAFVVDRFAELPPAPTPLPSLRLVYLPLIGS